MSHERVAGVSFLRRRLLGNHVLGEQVIYFYGRVSTDHQENSAANQRQIFEKLGEEWGEPYLIVLDEDVSGSVPLRLRPNGKPMWDSLRAGDVLIVTKLDRGWRSSEDAAHTLRVLREIGVRMRILDFPIDLSTDEGELMFLTFANFAQYENRLRGRRVKDVFEYRRRNGMPYASTRPYGWQRDGDRWKPLLKEREIADLMAELHADGLGYRRIADKLCRLGIQKITFVKSRYLRSWYNHADVRGLLLAREAGYPRVSQEAVRSAGRAGKSSSRAGRAPQTTP